MFFFFFFVALGCRALSLFVYAKEREEWSLLYFFSGVYLLILQSFVTLGSHFLRLNKPETALEKPLACTQGTSACIRHCKNQMETRTS